VLAQTKPGSIILNHDHWSQTADALPGILDALLEKNFEFTSISGFLGSPYGDPGAVPDGVTPDDPLPKEVPQGEPDLKMRSMKDS